MRADPLTVARYLAVRAGSGASIATLRLTATQPRRRGRGIETSQRQHYRHPLQDRHGGAGRGGSHHPHRHACPGRRPAGGGLVVRCRCSGFPNRRSPGA